MRSNIKINVKVRLQNPSPVTSETRGFLQKCERKMYGVTSGVLKISFNEPRGIANWMKNNIKKIKVFESFNQTFACFQRMFTKI